MSGNDIISTHHFRDTRPHDEGDMGYFKKKLKGYLDSLNGASSVNASALIGH